MNDINVPMRTEEMFHEPRLQTENTRIIPVVKSLDIIMDRLTDTESVLERILRCISASCPARDPQRPEFHSLQEQAKVIGEKSDRILNMANDICGELFGEDCSERIGVK